ncbi:hypothetical protein GH714_011989 [Hevea brasiliensis]|uniref:FAD dependent oxidoreductase domain-containing protein n=1 Tax=Hevea brasiliensis TaxID=3981 RepID=A0A6A6K4B1_HEVBR|nr:hypothetical protein GH714_011989 [Hevea brasiliensis]
MGSCTAYELAKRGEKTLLLEQFDFLHHRGSSHGESRTIRAAYPQDYYCAMAMESFTLWEEAQSEIGFKVYFKTQQFNMGPSDDKELLSVLSSFQKNSVPYQILDRQQTAEKFSRRINLPENWIGGLLIMKGQLLVNRACYSMTPDEDYVIDFLGGEFGKEWLSRWLFRSWVQDGSIGWKDFSGHGSLWEAKGVNLKHFRIQRFQENPKGNVKDF